MFAFSEHVKKDIDLKYTVNNVKSINSYTISFYARYILCRKCLFLLTPKQCFLLSICKQKNMFYYMIVTSSKKDIGFGYFHGKLISTSNIRSSLTRVRISDATDSGSAGFSIFGAKIVLHTTLIIKVQLAASFN